MAIIDQWQEFFEKANSQVAPVVLVLALVLAEVAPTRARARQAMDATTPGSDD